MSSRFDPGSTSKILNLSLLRFNERFGSENLGLNHATKHSLIFIYNIFFFPFFFFLISSSTNPTIYFSILCCASRYNKTHFLSLSLSPPPPHSLISDFFFFYIFLCGWFIFFSLVFGLLQAKTYSSLSLLNFIFLFF